jgi:hypothetical protein
MNGSTVILAGIVFAHLAVTIAHGIAHVGASVLLGPAAMVFVVAIIQVGPLAGLAYSRVQPVAGALIVASTMMAALMFGVINHYLVHGADHVSHVSAGWHGLFASTAALLFVTEAAGVAAGLWCSSRALRRIS